MGILSDVEVSRVNGGMMDMTWSEITFSTSDEHEDCLDLLHQIMFHQVGGGNTPAQHPKRKAPWKPHASLAYDNVDSSSLNLLDTVRVVSKYPTLMSKCKKVVGMSLWSTEGKIDDWRRLECFEF